MITALAFLTGAALTGIPAVAFVAARMSRGEARAWDHYRAARRELEALRATKERR